jgi:predicted ABC-type transport system involved in lysophospholipase L1 biosynthesis ATPase subunit
MVTHDEETAKRSQRIVRLRDGLVESDIYQVATPSG